MKRGGLGMALVTTFGLGHLRPASGTWGSLPPVLLAAVLIAAGLGPGEEPWVYHAVMGAVIMVFGLACVVMGDAAEARFLKKDPGQVVADETVGQTIALLTIPASALLTPERTAVTLVLAFLAFRVLDILKPWPAHQLQRVPGGWGILLDDLFAGAYAWGVVQVTARLALGSVE